jgi:hypothetical protein
MTLSLIDFLSEGETKSPSTPYRNARYATPAQLAFYRDLCEQKGKEEVEGVENLTFDEVSALINQLKSYSPISEKQKEVILNLIAELGEMGINVKEPNLDTLTGGRNGTGSKLIEQLLSMVKSNQDKAKPRAEQLALLTSMYLCPDVDFESYGVERRIMLTDDLWRRYTYEEFAQQLAEKLNRQQATEIIEKHRTAFHEWKQERITDEQKNYIRTLEARMASITTPKEVQWTVDIEGNLVPYVEGTTEMSPTAYTSIDEMELDMFSTTQAAQYIDILKNELANKSLTMYGEQNDGSLSFEPIRKPAERNEILLKDYELLEELMFKLEAVAGYDDEELHQAVAYMLVEDTDAETLAANRAKIKEFMQDIIEKDAITFEGLVELIGDCKTAQKILIG